MPGKINPTLSEMVIQIAHQVVGNDVAVSMATTRGELDLNVWDATFYKCLFESLQLVGDELVILRRDCVEGIVACEDRCPAEAESSIALSRVLATIFGYPEGVKVAHYCEEHGVTVKGGRPRLNEATHRSHPHDRPRGHGSRHRRIQGAHRRLMTFD